jgi:hypothetical protein
MITNKLNDFLNKNFDNMVNPYHEKWKRGRPTKEQKEKRKMSNKWVCENYRIIKCLLNSDSSEIIKNEAGVYIIYKPR